jgi:hypothetical protein
MWENVNDKEKMGSWVEDKEEREEGRKKKMVGGDGRIEERGGIGSVERKIR